MTKFNTLDDLLNRPVIKLTEDALVKFNEKGRPIAVKRGRGKSERRSVYDPKTKEYTDPQADPGDIFDLPSLATVRKYAKPGIYKRAADEQDIQYFMLQNVLQNLGLIKNILKGRRVKLSKSNEYTINKYKDALMSLFNKIKVSDDTDFEKFNDILTYTKTYLDNLAGFNISDMLREANKDWNKLIGDPEKFIRLLYTHYFISNFRSKEFQHNANIDIMNKMISLHGNEKSDSESSLRDKINKLGGIFNKEKDEYDDDDDDESLFDESVNKLTKKRHNYIIVENKILLEEDDDIFVDDDAFEELEDDPEESDPFDDDDIDSEEPDPFDDDDDDIEDDITRKTKFGKEAFEPTSQEHELTRAAVKMSAQTLYNIFNDAKKLGLTPYLYNEYITNIDGINTILNTPQFKANIDRAIEIEKANKEKNNEKFTFDDYKTAVLGGLALSINPGKPAEQVSNIVAREATASLLSLLRKFKQLSKSDDVNEEDREAYSKGLTLDNIFRYINTSDDEQAKKARENLLLYYNLTPEELNTENFPTFQAFAENLYKNDTSFAVAWNHTKNFFDKPGRKGALFQAIKNINRSKDSIIQQMENPAKEKIEKAEEILKDWNDNKIKLGEENLNFGYISFAFIKNKLNYELPPKLENASKKELENTKLFDFDGFTKSQLIPYINRASGQLSGKNAANLMREVVNYGYENYFDNIFAPSLIKNIDEEGGEDWDIIRGYIRQYISNGVSRVVSTTKFKAKDKDSIKKELSDKIEALIRQVENITGQKQERPKNYSELDDSDNNNYYEDWPYAIINVEYGIMPMLNIAKRNQNLDQATKEGLKKLYSDIKNNIIPLSFENISDDIKQFLIDKNYVNKNDIKITYESVVGDEVFDKIKQLRQRIKTAINTNRTGEVQNIIKTINKLITSRYTYTLTIYYKENTNLYNLSTNSIEDIMSQVSVLIKRQLIDTYKEKSDNNKLITDKLLRQYMTAEFDFAINKEYDSEDLIKDMGLTDEDDEEVNLACASIEPDCFEKIAAKHKTKLVYNNQNKKYRDAQMRNQWKNEYIWDRENNY